MRLLLDESVPRGLRRLLPGHEVWTVVEKGWGSLKNGALIRQAEREFDTFITADQGFEHEQNLTRLKIGIVVLVARTNRLVEYLPLQEALLSAVAEVGPGQLRKVESAAR